MSRFFLLLYFLTALPRIRTLAKNPISAVIRLVRGAGASAAFVAGAIGTAWAALCAMQRVLPRSTVPDGARVYLAGGLGGLWAFVQAHGVPPAKISSSSKTGSATSSSTTGGSSGTSSSDSESSLSSTASSRTAPARRHGSSRAAFTYTSRLALVSLWKTGVKRKWWTPVKNGDVVLFIAALAAMGALWEAGGEMGVNEGWVRKGLEVLKGGKRAAEEEAREGGWVDVGRGKSKPA